MKRIGFTPSELKSIAGLASVIGFRMLGLAALIPVFSVWAVSMPGATPFLAGVAFGVYGLTQAILQIPFGFLSDRLGRKPVVATGLLIFGIGSIMGALTDDIYLLIAARFLQGAGAIASASFAWIADLTHPSRRNMAMAFMGIAIGGGIVSGMIFGPVIGAYMGVPFLFWMAAALSGVALCVTLFVLKEPEPKAHDKGGLAFTLDPVKAFSYVGRPELLRLDFAGFVVNASMIAVFFAVPLELAAKFEMGELWKIYLPLAFMGGMAMMIFSRKADAGAGGAVIWGAQGAVAISLAVFALTSGVKGALAGFAIFFTAFSVMEAVLPATVSKIADPRHKGSIIGAFNFSQFMGTFAGGLLAGALAEANDGLLFWILAALNAVAAIWLMTLRPANASSPVHDSPAEKEA